MITIKAPIDLSIRTDYLQENDTFAERITGNYELMGLEIGEEELTKLNAAVIVVSGKYAVLSVSDTPDEAKKIIGNYM